ncbi:MAG: aldo/keto reductase [Thaumarchaeota archaeon]|nr:aldo/keto reductase [Nitrososphaerota archaeon]
MSTIGMGTWRMGTFRQPSERAEEVKVLRRGLDLGMNLIDTAEIYAGGKAEEVVGEVIKGERNNVFVATKVSAGHLRAGDVAAACQNSLRRLGTSYIDLYQVHWPNPGVPIRETMGAMEKLVEEGKVRYIGVSNFGVGETEEARAVLRKNELASNQVEYSLLNRGAETEVLPYCEREKVTLIAYTPLARGDISGVKIPKKLQDKYGMTTAQLMLNWVTRSEAVVAIPKSAKIAHTEENAASVSVRFSDSEYVQISEGQDGYSVGRGTRQSEQVW